MLILILGQNNTGKSAYAEKLIGKMNSQNRYYIATMIPNGDEGKNRVLKHLKMRAHLNMITLEDPFLQMTHKIEADSDVLLEDLSNLIANRMFEKSERSCDTVLDDITALNEKVNHLIVVSISKLRECDYTDETKAYVHRLNQLNHKLSDIADVVVDMNNEVGKNEMIE